MRATTWPLAVLVTLVSPAGGQQVPDALAPGDRVRIAAGDASGTYTLLRANAEALVLRSDASSHEVWLRTTSIERLEVRRAGSGGAVAKGALLGGLTGVLLVDVFWPEETTTTGDPDCGMPFCFSTRKGPRDGFVEAALGSVSLGAVAGMLLAARGRWSEVPLPGDVAVQATPKGGIGLEFVHRFGSR